MRISRFHRPGACVNVVVFKRAVGPRLEADATVQKQNVLPLPSMHDRVAILLTRLIAGFACKDDGGIVRIDEVLGYSIARRRKVRIAVRRHGTVGIIRCLQSIDAPWGMVCIAASAIGASIRSPRPASTRRCRYWDPPCRARTRRHSGPAGIRTDSGLSRST